LSHPRGRVRRGDQRADLFLREEFHRPSFEPLRGNRENPLTLQAQGRLGERDIPEEAMEGGETVIARARMIAPIPFQMLKEAFEEWRVQILHPEGGWRAMELLGREPKQQAERIAVARHGVGTDSLLRDQPLGEEAL
jgi:hypothetical protein